LDQDYSAAVQKGDWQTAAEKLNGFDAEDIQSRLAQLTPDQITNLHQGAVANPRVGPDSQVAQLTGGAAPAVDPARAEQIACVVRLGGCASSRDGGIPTPEEITNYNQTCRGETHYADSSADVTPTDDECKAPLPSHPLGGVFKIALVAAVVVGAVVLITLSDGTLAPVVIEEIEGGGEALGELAAEGSEPVSEEVVGEEITGEEPVPETPEPTEEPTDEPEEKGEDQEKDPEQEEEQDEDEDEDEESEDEKKCKTVWAAYKALGCSGCRKATTRTQIQAQIACLTAEIAGRGTYLSMRCDYILPGSIARGSAVAEQGHKTQVAEKSASLAKCVAKLNALPPE
jgi:hypothetical protein